MTEDMKALVERLRKLHIELGDLLVEFDNQAKKEAGEAVRPGLVLDEIFEDDPRLLMPLGEFPWLPGTKINPLISRGEMEKIRDLVAHDSRDILRRSGMGPHTVRQIELSLARNGLMLGMKIVPRPKDKDAPG